MRRSPQNRVDKRENGKGGRRTHGTEGVGGTENGERRTAVVECGGTGRRKKK